jgi:hypothetical protein
LNGERPFSLFYKAAPAKNPEQSILSHMRNIDYAPIWVKPFHFVEMEEIKIVALLPYQLVNIFELTPCRRGKN